MLYDAQLQTKVKKTVPCGANWVRFKELNCFVLSESNSELKLATGRYKQFSISSKNDTETFSFSQSITAFS